MTHEMIIDGKTYEFNFGMGFLRTVNKRVTRPIQGTKEFEAIGLQFALAKVIDGDIEGLYDVLYTANKGFDPRLTQPVFDAWIDDEDTDIDEVFKTVESFFEKSNCCRKMYLQLKEAQKEVEQNQDR